MFWQKMSRLTDDLIVDLVFYSQKSWCRTDLNSKEVIYSLYQTMKCEILQLIANLRYNIVFLSFLDYNNH